MNGLKEYGKGGFEGSKPAFDCENLILNSIGVCSWKWGVASCDGDLASCYILFSTPSSS